MIPDLKLHRSVFSVTDEERSLLVKILAERLRQFEEAVGTARGMWVPGAGWIKPLEAQQMRELKAKLESEDL